MTKVSTYGGKNISVSFDGSKCIHSRRCVLGLPGVFQANVEGPWINPDNAAAEEIAALARECPSGAITYSRRDGGLPESAPPVNTVFVRENGPLVFNADLLIDGEHSGFRATLCRCGASKNKPYCDGSHKQSKFQATGEIAEREFEQPDRRSGPVAVAALPNGPLQIEGNVEICSGGGHTIQKTRKAALCRCGKSRDKPFCDGTHIEIGFES
jgi:CDGSH-type Zn-finger protein/uncharacterized Fe-S cluster protein YjdI